VVTVVEPAASRIAAPVTGLSLSLEAEEDEVEDLEVLDEEAGFAVLEEREDEDEDASAFACSRSLSALILASFSFSSGDMSELELDFLDVSPGGCLVSARQEGALERATHACEDGEVAAA